MATRVQILNIDQARVWLALYYAVQSPDPSAVGRGPDPVAGADTRLSPAEVTSLKNGEIIQATAVVQIEGMDKPQIRSALEGTWSEHKANAEAQYAKRFKNESFVNFAWNGTTWS